MNEHTEPRKQNLFKVGFNLVLELVKTFHPQKTQQGLTSEMLQKIKLVLGENVGYRFVIDISFSIRKNVDLKYVNKKY